MKEKDTGSLFGIGVWGPDGPLGFFIKSKVRKIQHGNRKAESKFAGAEPAAEEATTDLNPNLIISFLDLLQKIKKDRKIKPRVVNVKRMKNTRR